MTFASRFRVYLRPAQNMPAWLMVTAMSVFTSCSSNDVELLPTHKVAGKVTYQDKPMANVMITFHPDVKGLIEGNPSAVADAEGNYELSTFEKGDGAPAGKYKVSFYWPESVPPGGSERTGEIPPDKLNGAFSLKKSKVTADVSGDNIEMNFDLP